MSTKSVLCPRCATSLDVPPALTGQKVECPVCKEVFVVEFPAEMPPKQSQQTSPSQGSKFSKTSSPSSLSGTVSVILASLACIIAISALILTLLKNDMPTLKLKKNLEDSLYAHEEFFINIESINNYFYKKNGKKILKSLDIREIKHNGNAAAIFYKLSLGATEVKRVIFMYQTREGFWLAIPEEKAEKKFPDNWLKDMLRKKKQFEKDSGEFDEIDF